MVSLSDQFQSDAILMRAQACLKHLDKVLEQNPSIANLSSLKTRLEASIAVYSCPTSEMTFEANLLQQTDLDWLCNQCDYYLSGQTQLPLRVVEGDLGLKEIYAATLTGNLFQGITILRSFFFKPKQNLIPWSDIWPNFQLFVEWLRG